MTDSKFEQLIALFQRDPVMPSVSLEFTLRTTDGQLLTTQTGEKLQSVKNQDISRIYTQTYHHINQYLQAFLDRQSVNGWLLMPGLRGTGKTTVLKQLYYSQPLRSLNKYYLSLDQVKLLDVQAEMIDIIKALEKILGTHLESFRQPLILFFDEVQYMHDWALGLKTIFDRCPNLFMVATGSSALSLQTNPDVARRVDLIISHPLNFSDFVNLKQIYTINEPCEPSTGLADKLNSALWQSVDAQQLFKQLKILEPVVKQYWQNLDKAKLLKEYQTYGSLPYTLNLLNPLDKARRVNHTLNTILLKDLAASSHLNSQNLTKIPRLLMMMSHSEKRSLNSLAKLLELNIKTLQGIINQLEQTEVIKAIKPWGAKMGHLTKPYRYLFSSPALRMALADESGRLDIDSQLRDRVRGFLWEDLVGLYLRRALDSKQQLTIEYDTQVAGADFIVGSSDQKKAIIIEVGLQKASSRQVVKTGRLVEKRYGLIITNNALRLDKEHQTVFVPLEFFLLA